MCDNRLGWGIVFCQLGNSSHYVHFEWNLGPLLICDAKLKFNDLLSVNLCLFEPPC